MKYLNLLIILFLFVGLFSESPIAVIAGMKGDVSVFRNEEKNTIKTGDLLYNADEVSSGIESFASIRFVDNGATAKLFPNSVLIIQGEFIDGKLSKRNILNKGSFLSKVNVDSGQYLVETPNIVASVKGTEFLVGYENLLSYIFVNSGEVEIENKITGDFLTAKNGQGYSINENGDISDIDNQIIEDFQDDFDNETPENSFESKTFDIEIQDADGNIKKVRITYEEE
ncbi:MAG: FecR domain-containing protein [Candidatus Cloacimonetes bacterium]|jgi:hypothetical protein|nr:FecR family protein [Candidatus Cloacimonadota bacterium]MDD4156054.1 FecR domain-containing protein [Candidatus Cloacimonadota bacterium]